MPLIPTYQTTGPARISVAASTKINAICLAIWSTNAECPNNLCAPFVIRHSPWGTDTGHIWDWSIKSLWTPSDLCHPAKRSSEEMQEVTWECDFRFIVCKTQFVEVILNNFKKWTYCLNKWMLKDCATEAQEDWWYITVGGLKGSSKRVYSLQASQRGIVRVLRNIEIPKPKSQIPIIWIRFLECPKSENLVSRIWCQIVFQYYN